MQLLYNMHSAAHFDASVAKALWDMLSFDWLKIRHVQIGQHILLIVCIKFCMMNISC